ncbi:MAG: DUF393 domain-containing protein, partial [Bdellovibrionales bacterium]|nr:DUF393 domain-containing protein [Bdellovibrionales bacterium]
MYNIYSMAEKSTLIYDGACKFCIQNVSFLERVLGTIFEKRSFREDGFIQEFPNVPLSECEQTVILLTSDGTKYKGAEAFVKLCQTKGGAY